MTKETTREGRMTPVVTQDLPEGGECVKHVDSASRKCFLRDCVKHVSSASRTWFLRLTFLTETVPDAVGFLHEEQNAGDDEPFPKDRRVEDEEGPVEDVEQMGPVEDLKKTWKTRG